HPEGAMSGPRKKRTGPPDDLTYIVGGVVEGENELTAGQPVPPLVELTPVAPSAASAVPISIRPKTAAVPQTAPGTSMPRTAFLFPGQGSQTVGMAAALCQSLPAAADLFQRAST